MCFSDVHHEKRDLTLVLIVELVKGGNLPPEWRSCVAAENHDYRLRLTQIGEPNSLTLVELEQRKVGNRVPRIQRACSGSRPKSFEWQDQEDLPRQVGHHPCEGLRRAMHGLPNEADKAKPQNEHDDENSRRDFLPAAAGLGGNRGYYRCFG